MERDILHNVRLLIKDYLGVPEFPPVFVDTLALSLWNGAAIAPGSRGDVRQYWMDNFQGQLIHERYAEDKLPAIGPGYQLAAEDNYPEDWQQFRSQVEQNRINEAVLRVTNDIAELQAKPSDQYSDSDKERMVELDRELKGLSTNGFLTGVPSTRLFGDSAMCVYRSLSSANVPFKYRSRFLLEQGRPVTLWFNRFQPRPGQTNHHLIVDLGSSLRIQFNPSDRTILFRKNEERDPAEWAAADARRDELIEGMYLTADQETQIRLHQEAIEAVQTERKLQKIDKKSPLYAPGEAKIKDLREKITTIRREKGLTPVEKAELSALDRFLFTEIETVQLSQTARSLVGIPFSLTFVDYGLGVMQIALDIGMDTWQFRDKSIISKHLWKWMWGVPFKETTVKGRKTRVPDKRSKEYNDEERITIRGNGGALAWRFGYAVVNEVDELVGPPEYYGTEFHQDAILPVTGLWNPKLPAPNKVEFELRPVVNPVAELMNVPPSYQTVVRFITDKMHVPLLFRAKIEVEPTERPDPVTVWDSADHPDAVIQAKPSSDGDSGSLYQIDIYSKEGDLQLPQYLRERAATIEVDGEPQLVDGLIAHEEQDGLTHVTSDTSPIPGRVVGGTHVRHDQLTIAGRERAVSHSRCTDDLILGGLYTGDAIYKALRFMGEPEWTLAGITRGAAGGVRLPSPAPGEKETVRPSIHSDRLAFIQSDIVEKFGLGWVLWLNNEGVWQWGPNRTLAINFQPSAVATDARLQYFEAEGKAITRSSSTEEFYTSIRVEGAVNPDTKKPFVAEWTLNEATDPRFKNTPNHIGHTKPGKVISDAGYNNQSYCDVVLRTQILWYGKIAVAWSASAPWHGNLIPKDEFQISTVPVRLKRAPADDLLEDEMTLEVETV